MIQLYRLDFTFRARPGWPPNAVLTVFVDKGFDVLKAIEQWQIQNLESIRLIDYEDKLP